MNKRQKKKRNKYKQAEMVMRAFGMALGKAQEEYYNELMNNYTEKAEKSPSQDQEYN